MYSSSIRICRSPGITHPFSFVLTKHQRNAEANGTAIYRSHCDGTGSRCVSVSAVQRSGRRAAFGSGGVLAGRGRACDGGMERPAEAVGAAHLLQAAHHPRAHGPRDWRAPPPPLPLDSSVAPPYHSLHSCAHGPARPTTQYSCIPVIPVTEACQQRACQVWSMSAAAWCEVTD